MAAGKILIIRFSSLGDVALVSPILTLLKESGFQIHLLTRTLPANLYFGDPRVDRIWRLEDYPTLSSLIRDIRDEIDEFDYIVDLHKQPRSIIITNLLRPMVKKSTFVYDKEALPRYLLLLTHRKILPIHHTIFRYLKAFPFLGKAEELWEKTVSNAEMPFFREEVEELEEDLSRIGKIPSSPMIYLAPGARYPAKRWPSKHFAQLATKLRKDGYNIGVVGGPDDRKFAEEIAGNNIDILDYTGLPPRKTILLLKSGRALITNDSAHQHFALLAGIPVITIFGPTVPEFGFYPIKEKDIIIQKKLKCRPCSMHGEKKCKRGDHICMKDISPLEVYEKTLKVIQ